MKIQCKSEEMIITLTHITLIFISCVDTTTTNPELRVAPFVRSAPKSTKYIYFFRVLSHCIPFVCPKAVFWFPITMPGNNFANNYRQAPIIESRADRRGEGAAIGYLRNWLKVFKYNELWARSLKDVWCHDNLLSTVELDYDDLAFCDTFIRTNWFPIRNFFSAMLTTTYIRSSTSDIPSLSIIIYSVILQEVGYFQNSALSPSLRSQAFHSS